MQSEYKVLVFVAVLLAFITCKDNSCPQGLVRQGNTCVPIPDNTPKEVIIPDNGQREEEVEAHTEIVTDTKEDKPVTKDTHEETGAEAPGVGSPCKRSADCRSPSFLGDCLTDWPEGYCTLLDCLQNPDSACPEGSYCLGITPNLPACAKACQQASDCRENYGCKAIFDPQGALKLICYPATGGGQVNDACTTSKDCAGDATCLTSFDKGYCAVIGCDRCGEGTKCVKFNDLQACLKECTSDEDCNNSANALRKCAEMKLFEDTSTKVKVCTSQTLGKKVGESCLSDIECDSEHCEIVYTGMCSDTQNTRCRTDSDCPAGICLSSPSTTVGFCTKACSISTPCPAGSMCIGDKVSQNGVATGYCSNGCSGIGDKTCLSSAGLSCVFGDPIGGQARYYCARLSGGVLGSLCHANSDCSNGQCLLSTQGAGYCYSPCGFGEFCPFPTSCQTAFGQRACYLRCMSNDDCPLGHECVRPQDSMLDICYPKKS